MFWSSTVDTCNQAISNAMRRDRFYAIIKCLHFNPSDSLDPNDKFANLRCLISYVQKKFMDNFIPSQSLSLDETMVEKQFGKSASTILYLLESYSEDKKKYPYHFYFDNLFTTFPLLAKLKNRGYSGTGTGTLRAKSAGC